MTQEPMTLVIPYVSGIAYLRETLASVARLDGTHWRAIVSDNTRDPAESALAKDAVAALGDSRITVRSFDRHVDICASFNRSMECAPTDLVTLLHSDDRIMPGYATAIADLASRYPDAAVYYCGARIIGGDGRPMFSFVDFVKRFLIRGQRGLPTVLSGRHGVEALARGNFIMSPTVCFRLSRLGDARWLPEFVQVADLELWTRVLFNGGTLVGTSTVAYEYRRHSAQSTALTNKTFLRYREEAAVYNLTADRAKARGWKTAERIARGKLVTRLHVLYDIAVDLMRLDLRTAGSKFGFLLKLR
jgi:glycosyltransferase involved in cell wall biosynthesis